MDWLELVAASCRSGGAAAVRVWVSAAPTVLTTVRKAVRRGRRAVVKVLVGTLRRSSGYSGSLEECFQASRECACSPDRPG